MVKPQPQHERILKPTQPDKKNKEKKPLDPRIRIQGQWNAWRPSKHKSQNVMTN